MSDRVVYHRKRDRRNKTGCVGVKFKRVIKVLRGVKVVRSYFVARMGRSKSRNFCIDMLGKQLAWQEAVCCRAAWEKEIQGERVVLEPELRKRRTAKGRRWRDKNWAAYRATNRTRINKNGAAAQRRYRAKKGK